MMPQPLRRPHRPMPRPTPLLRRLRDELAETGDAERARGEPSLASREFFLRKGIGWALRQYAWTDPREVIRYVRRNRERLSPLSKREALKNVLKQGLIARIP